MRLLVTRQREEADELARRLQSLGHEAVIEPLLVVELLPDAVSDPTPYQAVVLTSRNAVRALAKARATSSALLPPPLWGSAGVGSRPEHGLRGPGFTPTPGPSRQGGGGSIPPVARRIFAVGPGTADLARALGLADPVVGPGTAVELATLLRADLSPDAGPILYLTGETIAHELAINLAGAGFRVDRAVVYRAAPPAALSETARREIAGGRLDGVLLMSPATAATFVRLVELHGVTGPAAKMTHYCLSTAVAGRLARLGAADVRVAARPRLEELLALVSA